MLGRDGKEKRLLGFSVLIQQVMISPGICDGHKNKTGDTLFQFWGQNTGTAFMFSIIFSQVLA